MTAASIYARYGTNTVLRFRYDTESLTGYRVRAYRTRMPEGTSQIGEADGVAAGQILSIPVQVSDLPANTIHTLTVRKVDANDVETVLTLDRTYELKITEDY